MKHEESWESGPGSCPCPEVGEVCNNNATLTCHWTWYTTNSLIIMWALVFCIVLIKDTYGIVQHTPQNYFNWGKRFIVFLFVSIWIAEIVVYQKKLPSAVLAFMWVLVYVLAILVTQHPENGLGKVAEGGAVILTMWDTQIKPWLWTVTALATICRMNQEISRSLTFSYSVFHSVTLSNKQVF